MKSVISRLKSYRYNKSLFKNVYKKRRMGFWDKNSLKMISKCANVVLLTFVIRFFSRIYVMYQSSGVDLATFFHHKYIYLAIWLLVYVIFANYLLGIGNTDPKIKRYGTKYIKTLGLLILYTTEIFINLFFFMDGIYDYSPIAIIALLSLIPTLICYVCLFLIMLDFIMYTTDNSDDIEKLKGESVDYF